MRVGKYKKLIYNFLILILHFNKSLVYRVYNKELGTNLT